MSDDDPRYAPEVRRRMRELPCAGRFAGNLARVCTGRAGAESQGAAVELHLHVAGDRVVEARFLAYGCPHLIASASWLSERLRGCSRAQVEAWDWREAQAALDVPASKIGRLLTLQDAARDAARNWVSIATVSV